MNTNTNAIETSLSDDKVLAIVDALLEYECVPSAQRIKHVIEREDGVVSLQALAPLVDRWQKLRAPLTGSDSGQVLAKELPEYNGWTAAWEYPGYLALHREGYPTVLATPDYADIGDIAVEVHNDKHLVETEAIAWPLAGRTVDGFLAAMRPFLDGLKSLAPAPKDEPIVGTLTFFDGSTMRVPGLDGNYDAHRSEVAGSTHGPSCDPDEIFERVMRAMQVAEEIGGPEGAQYVTLMQRIANEAEGRARRMRERLEPREWIVTGTPGVATVSHRILAMSREEAEAEFRARIRKGEIDMVGRISITEVAS